MKKLLVFKMPIMISICVWLLAGCASFQPAPMDVSALSARAKVQTNAVLAVSVAWLGDAEIKQYFDLPLAEAGIQPLWVQIRNDGSQPCWLLPAVTDPYYFSAAEALQKVKSSGWHADRKNRRKSVFLEEEQLDNCILPGTTQQGFIYASRKAGMRQATVALFSQNGLSQFIFLLEDGRLRTDHRRVDFDRLTAPEQQIALSEETLQAEISRLPAYTMNAAGTQTGDPLNLVLIGSREQVFSALAGAGWDETESLNMSSAARTVYALIAGTPYRFSPVSPLYVFGRRQDAAFQKIRKNIHTRCHMRLWLTPYTYENRPLWLGQISRDIGIRMTTKTPNLTTHLIDPDVDGDRWYFIQEMLKQQALARIGFADGGKTFTPLDPGKNLTGDLFFTDGLRAVLLLSRNPAAVDEIGFWSWKFPPRGGLSNPGDYLQIDE